MSTHAYSVKSLSDITKEYFEKLCIQLLFSDTEPKGVLRVPCSTDVIIWEDPDSKALVNIRVWSNMLELFVRDHTGIWLVHSHIDGLPIDRLIEFGWIQLTTGLNYMYRPNESAKNYVSKLTDFSSYIIAQPLRIMACLLWMESTCDTGPDVHSAKDIAVHTNLSVYKVRKLLKALETNGFVHLINIGDHSTGKVRCFKGWHTTHLIDAIPQFRTMKYTYELLARIDKEN